VVGGRVGHRREGVRNVSFKSEQGKLQKKGYSKESAGKILGAAAQKAKHPSANQKKVLRHQGKKVK
jgi:hypothetical protein